MAVGHNGINAIRNGEAAWDKAEASEGEKRTHATAAMQRVRDLHERRDGADGAAYCDLCSNHGDVTWPCATIRALDTAEQ